VTFGAPKSVSLLYGLGPDWVANAVSRAHDTAAKDALRYLERHALLARRGAGGERRVATTGAVAVAFRHRTSRSGDPQLHTHVLLANIVEDVDGRWSAPDARLVYFHGRTAGFVYQSVLRAELSEHLGVRFEPATNGLAEIEGTDKAMLRAFATRRTEIEVRLEQWGATSARAAEIAIAPISR
jgi:conjugative relaxase-like TrwC/TraI family protein